MPKLAIDIEARFAQVIDGLDAIGKKADQQARSIERSFKAAGVVLASIFSAAVINEQLSAFRSTLDSLADLDDAAAQAGTTVEKFSEAWLFLRPTGVSVEQLSGIVDTLFKQLSKGGKEGEKVAKALSEIGVNARDAAGNLRDPVVLLEEMAKGLAEFENDPNKVGLIYEILGKRAKEAIPVLEDLGKKQGETASITTDLASKSEVLANQFRAIEQVGDNLRINFLAAYIDDISTLTAKYLESTKAGAGFLESLVNIAAPDFRLDALTTSLETFQKKLAELKNPSTFTKELEAFGLIKPRDKAIRETEEAIATLEKQIERLRKVRALSVQDTFNDRRSSGEVSVLGKIAARSGDDPKKVAKERETEAEKLQKWLDQQVNAAEKYNLLEQTAIKIMEAREKANHGITDAIEEQLLATARMVVEQQNLEASIKERADYESFIAKVLDDDARRVEKLTQSYRELIDPTERYRQQLKEINELQRLGDLDAGLAEKARGAVFKEIDDLEKGKKAIDDINVYSRTAAESIQGHLADFLFDPFKDGLKGMAENFAKTIQRMLADAAAASLMRTLLGDYAKTGTVGGILGGLLSSGGNTGFGTGAAHGNQDYGQFLGSDAVTSAVSTKGSTVINQTNNINAGQPMSDWRVAREIQERSVAAVEDRRMRAI